MKVRGKLGLIAVGVVLVLAVSALVVGVAAAQGGDGDDGDRPSFAERVAEKLGIDEQELLDAVKAAQLDILDEAVARGAISSERADAIRERIEEGAGLGLCGRAGEHMGLRFLGGVVRTVAESLDLEPRALIDELRDGKSLAEIAEARGVSREELKTTVVNAVDSKLDQAVAGGKITQERADEILARLNENIDRILDWTPGGDFFGEGVGSHWRMSTGGMHMR